MTDRRGDIQWLRAIAALEVVLIHSDLATKHISETSIVGTTYAYFGGIGVEVFFLVSGFIISMVYQVVLESTELKKYILTAPRTDLISQNREGVFSLAGYRYAGSSRRALCVT